MSREEQKLATRLAILDAAVASLIELGVARTTTLAVQRRADVSRGALLHYFPTHAQLLSSTVQELVRRNEAAVSRYREQADEADPVTLAIRTMTHSVAQPAFLAEIELWAVARTDAGLREALQAAERAAQRDHERVMAFLFSAVRDRPAYRTVIGLSVEFSRGLALSGVLRRNPERRRQLVEQWIWAVRILLDQPVAPDTVAAKRRAKRQAAVSRPGAR